MKSSEVETNSQKGRKGTSCRRLAFFRALEIKVNSVKLSAILILWCLKSIPFYIAHGNSSPFKESKNKANENLETATEDITYPEDEEVEGWDDFPNEHKVDGDIEDEENEVDEEDEGDYYPSSMEEKDENIEEVEASDKDSKKCQG